MSCQRYNLSRPYEHAVQGSTMHQSLWPVLWHDERSRNTCFSRSVPVVRHTIVDGWMGGWADGSVKTSFCSVRVRVAECNFVHRVRSDCASCLCRSSDHVEVLHKGAAWTKSLLCTLCGSFRPGFAIQSLVMTFDIPS